MNELLDLIQAKLKAYDPALLDYFSHEDIKSKTILLNEGEVSKNIYFIKKGAVRIWINNNGEDITAQFFFEGGIVSGLFGREISPYTIETIEPSTIVTISIVDFYKLVELFPSLKDRLIDSLFERLRHYVNLFIFQIKESPEQRYLELLKNEPELLQRVPQHYIATYLGVTSVSLSRIRNRVLKM